MNELQNIDYWEVVCMSIFRETVSETVAMLKSFAGIVTMVLLLGAVCLLYALA